MNTKRFLLTLLVLIVTTSLVLAACAPAAPAAENMDPVTVVKAFYEAYNANDIDKAMSLTAEDYVMNDPSGTYNRAGAADQEKYPQKGAAAPGLPGMVGGKIGRASDIDAQIGGVIAGQLRAAAKRYHAKRHGPRVPSGR